jgi:hypothetical protein
LDGGLAAQLLNAQFEDVSLPDGLARSRPGGCQIADLNQAFTPPFAADQGDKSLKLQ